MECKLKILLRSLHYTLRCIIARYAITIIVRFEFIKVSDSWVDWSLLIFFIKRSLCVDLIIVFRVKVILDSRWPIVSITRIHKNLKCCYFFNAVKRVNKKLGLDSHHLIWKKNSCHISIWCQFPKLYVWCSIKSHLDKREALTLFFFAHS